MKKKMSILGALVLAVVVTAASVSGTYAKYTGGAEVTDSARVAKFEVTSKNAQFDIFNTNTTAGDTIIAPGYSGSVTLSFANMVEVNSEVPTVATFGVVTTGTKASKTLTHGSYDPMRYTLVEGTDLSTATYKTWNEFVADVATMKADKTYTIAWKWSQETGDYTDTDDTALGNAIVKAIADSDTTTIEELTARLIIGVTVEQDTTNLNTAN